MTTNSITQVFQRRTVERWTGGPRPLSLVYAIPDHPWTRATKDSAAVRIAMSVAEAGHHQGELLTVASEAELDTDAPVIALQSMRGRINPDLTVGTDVTRARPLKANAGLCSPGVKLHGSGFIVTRAQAAILGLGQRQGLEAHLRPYRNGRDLTGRSRDAFVIDLFGLEREEVRDRFPEVYVHLVENVKEARDASGRLVGRDANARAAYRDGWWIFGEPRGDLRPALAGLPRYIATVETAKHRVFQFLDAAIIPDNKLLAFALDDAAELAVLSSRAHRTWYLANAGKLGVYDRDAVYVKSRCFDPFPFPVLEDDQRRRLRAVGEALDAHRKQVLSEHPDLTLTGLYNSLEANKSGDPLSPSDQETARRARTAILRELHDDIDRQVAEAYGWEADQTDAEIVAALASLNRARGVEEARGQVRWLRPGYQAPRSGPRRIGRPDTPDLAPAKGERARRPAFPSDKYEQPLALQAALAQAAGPVGPDALARGFSGGLRLRPKIDRVLTTLHRYGHVERLSDGRWIAAGL